MEPALHSSRSFRASILSSASCTPVIQSQKYQEHWAHPPRDQSHRALREACWGLSAKGQDSRSPWRPGVPCLGCDCLLGSPFVRIQSSHLSPASRLCPGLQIYEVLSCRLGKDAPAGVSTEDGREGDDCTSEHWLEECDQGDGCSSKPNQSRNPDGIFWSLFYQ